MELYRTISIIEAYSAYKSGYIMPKWFVGNSDSTCKPGPRSFWFGKKIRTTMFEYVVVKCEYETPQKSIMSFGCRDGFYDDDPMVEYQIDEFTIDIPVKITGIFTNKDYSSAITEEYFLELLESININIWEDYEYYINEYKNFMEWYENNSIESFSETFKLPFFG